MKDIKEGTEMFSVATGRVDPWRRKSREAAKYIRKQEGFMAVSPTPYGGMLWLFDTENHAKAARNMMKLRGIVTGSNICRFTYENKQLVFDTDYAKREGFNG